MIKRYYGSDMAKVWEGNLRKCQYWREVELAVLKVREGLGQVPPGTEAQIRVKTFVDEVVAKAIELRERAIKHDLNAFVEIMRIEIILDQDRSDNFFMFASRSDIHEHEEKFNRNCDYILAQGAMSSDAGWFHDGMTSYDTEEPAMAMLLRDACNIINVDLDELTHVLRERAKQFRGALMIGRTHGQHAQPITFGFKCLNWYDMVGRAGDKFEETSTDALAMKLSGAVGMYGTLTPEVEAGVADELGLTPVIATQIVALDYRARVVNELAVIAGIVEKIANDLWHMSQTEVGEIREPFGKRQKGSSAMPHKKNPVALENIRGCASLVRGYAMAMLEQIATSHERDISHSSVERMAVVDAFGIVDHMLRSISNVVDYMQVFPERMLENLNATHGTIASQKVEMFLKKYGVGAEDAYRLVQAATYRAIENEEDMLYVLLKNEVVTRVIEGDPAMRRLELESFFDWSKWVEHEAHAYNHVLLADD